MSNWNKIKDQDVTITVTMRELNLIVYSAHHQWDYSCSMGSGYEDRADVWDRLHQKLREQERALESSLGFPGTT